MKHRIAIAPAWPPLLRAIAWMLIAAIVAGGLPMLTGVVVIADSKPAFTLDLCHPIGGASYNLSQSEAPLIPTNAAAQPPADWGAAREFVLILRSGPRQAPDPPPPKIV